MIQRIPVLDKGYVSLIDVMGNDLRVVNAAKASYKQQSPTLGEREQRLLRYLHDNRHWSPFAHPHVTLEIKAPVMVINQWRKHGVGSRFAEVDDSGWNEASGRYIELDEYYVPEIWRSRPANSKQGSGEPLCHSKQEQVALDYENHLHASEMAYRQAIDDGVAKEQARLFLPYAALYTYMYWTASLYRILTFLELREDEHAQFEIRHYAHAVHDLVAPHFSETFKLIYDKD